jgi:hypothetical protein
MIISLMLLYSNANLLANNLVATSAGRLQGASGFVVSDENRAEPDALAALEIAQSPDEWPLAL